MKARKPAEKSSEDAAREARRKRREALPIREFLPVDELKKKFEELTVEEFNYYRKKVEEEEANWKPVVETDLTLTDFLPTPEKFPIGTRFLVADGPLVVAMPGGTFVVSLDGKKLIGPMSKEEEARVFAEFPNKSVELASETEFRRLIVERAAGRWS